MRQLHVVALSADGRSLLLASAPKGARASYRVAVDAKLQSALRGERANARQAAAAPDPRPESALSPREMQTRLRAGQSVESVAKAAGVSVDRVEGYFAPVLAERIQVIDDAQAATMTTPRKGESSRSLGASVAINLAPSAGVELDTVDWSARRRVDGAWVVRLEYLVRGRRRTGQWEWNPRMRELHPLDSTASSLGYVDASGAARRTTTPSRKPARKAAVRATGRKKAAKKAPARKKAAARKTTAKRASTTSRTKTTAKRATTARKKTTAKRATTARKKTATSTRKATRTATTRKAAKRTTTARRSTRRR